MSGSVALTVLTRSADGVFGMACATMAVEKRIGMTWRRSWRYMVDRGLVGLEESKKSIRWVLDICV